MKVVNNNYLQADSIVDGIGLRMVLWTQGCPHKCPGCHNPSTHNISDGQNVLISEIKSQIKKLASSQDGITLSGGDPFYQPTELLEIVKYCNTLNLNVWCYTGFLYESLLKDDITREILSYINVLVDGPFIESKKSLDLKFKGSSNQRLIDVKESLKKDEVILYQLPNSKIDINREGIFV